VATDLLDAQPDPQKAAEQRRQTAEALLRGNVPVHESGKAKVTIAVFSDFQCPYCARMAKTLEALAGSEGESLRVVYHFFPLSNHPWAWQAAEAGACAVRQSNAAFWSLHDFLFAHQRELSPDNFAQRVTLWVQDTQSLDQGRFERCRSEHLTSGQIEQDMALGEELGVRGTPTVFVNGDITDSHSEDELRTLVRRVAGSE
jgi:protein-disulfide isomerase